MRRLEEIAPEVPRGLWSASQDLRRLDEADLALAWFVNEKSRPIGELVQAICHAVYGQKTAFDKGTPDDGEDESEGRHQRPARSGWVRRDDVLGDIEDAKVSPGSSSP